ncbi:TPA: hypothetical protein U2I27_003990 [Citrobacter farmeri]|nr:hypothetical protein [Citrobacter farmeri]
MMKCYLANTGNGHFITADEAATGEPGPLTCTSCGCVLYALPGNAAQSLDMQGRIWRKSDTTIARMCIQSRRKSEALGFRIAEFIA